MNKKLFAIGIFALFLVVSIGVVSAQTINVQLSGDVPDQVSVSLLCDGNVVETVKLGSANPATTFDVDGNGSYSVVAKGSSDYSFSVSGSADNGFIINSKHVGGEKLPATDDNQQKENKSVDDTQLVENSTIDKVAADVNDTVVGNASDDNSTDVVDGTVAGNASGDNTTGEVEVNTTSTSDANKIVTQNKVVKKENQKPVEKKENKTTKVRLLNTGLPLMVLVIALFAVIFIPINRRK